MSALDDMLALRDLEDKLRDFEQKMSEADRDYRGAKAVLQGKTIYVVQGIQTTIIKYKKQIGGFENENQS